jgi:hypothetical protein
MLPVFAVGRIGDLVVKVVGEDVVAEGGAETNVVGVAAVGRLHVEVRLANREGLGVHLLSEEMKVCVGVHALPNVAALDVSFGDRQHFAGAAAGVADGTDDAFAPNPLFVARQHEIHHQVDDVAGCEVLARVLVEGLVELADQLLEPGPLGCRRRFDIRNLWPSGVMS